jgi:hypothetical protein
MPWSPRCQPWSPHSTTIVFFGKPGLGRARRARGRAARPCSWCGVVAVDQLALQLVGKRPGSGMSLYCRSSPQNCRGEAGAPFGRLRSRRGRLEACAGSYRSQYFFGATNGQVRLQEPDRQEERLARLLRAAAGGDRLVGDHGRRHRRCPARRRIRSPRRAAAPACAHCEQRLLAVLGRAFSAARSRRLGAASAARSTRRRPRVAVADVQDLAHRLGR